LVFVLVFCVCLGGFGVFGVFGGFGGCFEQGGGF
jgi:hypothetical protein